MIRVIEDWLTRAPFPSEYFEVVSSTMDAARALAMTDPPVKLYVAKEQTLGRGRHGRVWLSPPGSSLLITYSLALPSAPSHLVAPRAGERLLFAAQGIWPMLRWSVKPPNDLYLPGGKVAGVLCESLSTGEQHRLLIGIGMNLTSHPDTEAMATHLNQEAQGLLTDLTLEQFLQLLSATLSKSLADYSAPELSDRERAHLLAGIQANPYAGHGLTDLKANGDLVYGDREVPWSDL